MKEIEVLLELTEPVLSVKEKLGIVDFDSNIVIDTYFESSDHLRLSPKDDGRLFSSLRLREKNGKCLLTYKDDHFDSNGIWLYSDEHETHINDIDILNKIFGALGYKELVTVKNTKHTVEIGEYEITLEEVENLGNFIEIEYKGQKDVDKNQVESVKEEMRNFLRQKKVGFGDEMNAGKPELLLKKMAKGVVNRTPKQRSEK